MKSSSQSKQNKIRICISNIYLFLSLPFRKFFFCRLSQTYQYQQLFKISKQPPDWSEVSSCEVFGWRSYKPLKWSQLQQELHETKITLKDNGYPDEFSNNPQ